MKIKPYQADILFLLIVTLCIVLISCQGSQVKNGNGQIPSGESSGSENSNAKDSNLKSCPSYSKEQLLKWFQEIAVDRRLTLQEHCNSKEPRPAAMTCREAIVKELKTSKLSITLNSVQDAFEILHESELEKVN